MTQEDREAAIAAVRSGRTRADVARQYGVTRSWVTHLCRREGIRERPTAEETSRIARERMERMKAMRAEGKSYRAIAVEIGVCWQRVRKLLLAEGEFNARG